MNQTILYKKNNVKRPKFLIGLSLFILIIILIIKFSLKEQPKEIKFINEIVPEAMELKQQTGILPSVTIAQAIIESNFGKSELAVKANNLFGIKGSYHGNSIKMPTKEYENNRPYTTEAEFRAYPDWKSALIDHTKLFLEGTSWNKHQYQEVLAAENYKEAAYALKTSNYSTDPNYPEKLITIIKQYQLEKYDD